jgi:hypothetical protein
MQIRTLSAFLAFGGLAAMAASADDPVPPPAAPPVAPAPAPDGKTPVDKPAPSEKPAPPAVPASGTLVAVGDGIGDLEVFHDAAGGVLTINAVQPAGGAFLLAEPPTVFVATSDGGSTKEVRFAAVEGRENSWIARDDALRDANLSAQIRVKVGGTIYASRYRAEPATLVEPAAGVEPVLTHGGRLLVVFGDRVARLEMVHDATAGTLTFFAVDTPERKTVFVDAPRVTLRMGAGPKELVLQPVAGKPGQWIVTDPDLATPSLIGAVKVKVDGKDLEASLAAPALFGTKPIVTARTDEAGMTLMFGDQGSVARLQMRHDPATSKISFVVPKGAKAVVFDEPPILFWTVAGAKEPIEIPLRADEKDPTAWVAVNDEFKSTEGTISGIVRVKVAGHVHEATFTHSTEGPASPILPPSAPEPTGMIVR